VIDVQEPQSMLLVPQNAVKTTRGVSTVQKKLSDGTTQSVEVSVKYLGEGYYQVLSGDIADGDTVMMQTTASTNAASSMMMSMSSGSDTGGGPGGGGGEPPQR
jgi:multidrug efflux pump subunit AcrA (membrane-fusion protein)